MSRKRCRFLLPFFVEIAATASVSNLVLKDRNLHFRSMWDKICTTKLTHNNINGRKLVISMSTRVTNGSGLILVGNGGEHTFKHISTYKNK